MTTSDSDFDNEHYLDDNENVDDSVEAHVWQLLLLINPGDEETAMQQFSDYRDAGENDAEPIEIIRRVVDWRSGFHVDAQDTHALVQAIDELSSRWNIFTVIYLTGDTRVSHGNTLPKSRCCTCMLRLRMADCSFSS